MYLRVCLAWVVCSVIISCASVSAPTITRIKAAEINSMNTRSIQVKMMLEIFNNDENSLRVNSFDLEALSDGLLLDKYSGELSSSMLGKSTFDLPLEFALSLSPLAKRDGIDVMAKGLRIYNGGELPLTIKGQIEVTDGRSVSILPIEYSQQVIFRKNLK